MAEWLSVIFRFKEKKAFDILGKYPTNIHTPAFPERRYLWTSRLLVICACLSICLTIILAMTIFLLLPQRGAKPLLLEKDETHQVIKSSRNAEVIVNAREMLEEKAVRDYVVLRHEILSSYNQMARRWDESSEFYYLSSPEEYSIFTQTMNYTTISQFISAKMIRKVNVVKADKIKENLWRVQFSTTTTTKKNPEPSIMHWRAYIRLAYLTPNEGDAISSHNPLMINVVKYNLSYIGKEGDSQSYLETAKNIHRSKK
ncbi:MAG: hypothetical protein E7012_06420 [Alphaproteobacteria bacterium]|nr:hypothetical protein [Alphaproteobacteria bacterium]